MRAGNSGRIKVNAEMSKQKILVDDLNFYFKRKLLKKENMILKCPEAIVLMNFLKSRL